MSKKANPTSIGMFIVAGLALGVAGLVLFSSGKFFSKQQDFILYFDSSLKGLNPGAPVKLRGVTIGAVKEVLIRHNQASNDFAMPVIIEIDQKLLQAKTDRSIDIASKVMQMEALGKGLRGRLEAESLVTGVLYVELEIVPDAPKVRHHQIRAEYIEIPTTRSDIEELLSNLAHFDIRGLSEKLNNLLTRLDTSLGQLNVREINAGVTNLLVGLERIIGSPDLTNTLAELRQAVGDARGLLKRLDNQVDPLADNVKGTLQQAQQALAEVRRGVDNFSRMLEPNAPLRTDLTRALEQLGNTANAFTDLAEFLQRNPNALITGRKPLQLKP